MLVLPITRLFLTKPLRRARRIDNEPGLLRYRERQLENASDGIGSQLLAQAFCDPERDVAQDCRKPLRNARN